MAEIRIVLILAAVMLFALAAVRWLGTAIHRKKLQRLARLHPSAVVTPVAQAAGEMIGEYRPGKYILMMHLPLGPEDEPSPWSVEGIRAHVNYLGALTDELAKSGELVEARSLDEPRLAITVYAGKKEAPIVIGGPQPDSHKCLTGYWIVEVQRPERAYEIAAKISAAPGAHGEPLLLPIEVRRLQNWGPPMLDPQMNRFL